MKIKESIPHGNVLQKYISTKSWNYFHVFADGKDQYIPYDALSANPNVYENRRKAFDLAGEWFLAGSKNLRVYMVEEKEDYRDGEILTNKEECILSIGNYPY